MAYKRKDLEDSEEMKARQAALDRLGAMPTYTPQNTAALQAAKDKILNREKFSYNVNADALYKQYNDQYTRLGKMAMQDTMGQAAALTGGYGNSYAMTAGQQAYQGYMQELADKVPELEQLAYQRYQAEGDELLNQYGILADAEAQEYSRYQDKLADWYTQRGILADELADATDRAWNKYTFDVTQDYTAHRDEVLDERYDTEWQNQVERQAIEDQRYDTEWRYGIEQDAIANDIARIKAETELAEAQASGYTEDEMAKAATSDRTKLFKANLMSAYDFGRTGGSVKKGDKTQAFDTYKEYIDAKLEEAFDNGELTENEVAYLLGYYGIEH